MKRLFILLGIGLLCWVNSNSQENQSNRSGQRGQRPAIGVLSGILLEAESKKPIEFATVAIRSAKDSSVIDGAISNSKGEFSIEKIKLGRYYAEVSLMGYEQKQIDSIFFSPKSPEKFIGKIYLKVQSNQLGEVTIKGEKPLMITKLDKKVFDVSQLTTATGGTANDILENLPSIQVDIDGSISLRGSSNITILIDGRPSGIVGNQETILEQIPAETIESIELITNPSAKYNPENMSGIINVVLKKEKRKGFNTTINAGINTNPGQNATIGLNYRTAKFNLYGSYTYRDITRDYNGTNYRETQLGDTLQILDQFLGGARGNTNHTTKTGIDLYLNKKNTLFVSTLVQLGDGLDDEEVNSDFFNDHFNNFDFNTIREATEIEDEFAYDISVGHQKTFLDPGKEWTTDLLFSRRNDDEYQDFLQNNFDEDGFVVAGSNLNERVSNKRERTQINFQSDYVHPLDENRSIEIGTQIILTENDGDYVFEQFDDTQDQFLVDFNISNRFIFNQDVYSAYGLYGQKIKNFQFKGGLRFETAEIRGDQVSSGEQFSFDYFSLFPSLHLSQKLSDRQEIQASYSRRIQRPRERALNPFEDYTDPNNVRVGNPELRPEYISSFELNYVFFWNKVNITSGIYFRDIQNVMRRFRTVDDSTGVAFLSWVNLESGQNYGFEFVFAGRPTKSLRFNASFDLFKSVLNGSNLEADLNGEAFSWSSRLMASYSFPKSIEAQVSYRYLAPNVTAQGEWSGFFSSDFSVKKTFMDGDLSVTARLSDIFDTREFSFISSGDNFSSEGYRKRRSRIFNISIFYRFGKFDDQDNKRKRKGNNFNGGGFEPDM